MAELRTAVIIDYQNVHLTGHAQFDSTRYGPKHDALVDPLHFANQLIQVRNSRQREGHERAVLRYVDVFRGEPSPAQTTIGKRTLGTKRRRHSGSATSAST